MWPLQDVNEVSHIIQIDQIPAFVTTRSIAGIVLSGPLIDYESPTCENELARLTTLIKRLSPRQVLRLQIEVTSTDARSSRLLVAIEEQIPGILGLNPARTEERLARWLRTLPLDQLNGFGFFALDSEALKEILANGASSLVRAGRGMHQADHWTGAIRLNRQTPNDVYPQSVFHALAAITPPFTAVATVKRLDRLQAQKDLRLLESRKSQSADAADALQAAAAQDAIVSTFANDEELCLVEWIVILNRVTEGELNRDLGRASDELETIGEPYIETVGLRSTLRAAHFGSPQHFTFKELSSVVPFFLPAVGSSEATSGGGPGTLTLERVDGTPFHMNPFDQKWGGCNIIINGKRGGGKSVTANLLSRALLSDPACQMIKFDVGGSYRKECALANGSVFDFQMDEPSGINPFEATRKGGLSGDEIRSIAGFVAALAQESGEVSVPDTIIAQIESEISRYVAGNSRVGSLSEFVSNSKDLPRKELLKRWSEGVYKHVFRATPDARERLANRYVYFNLEHLHSAADTSYIRGVFAALIAYANIAMLDAGDARSQTKKRLVLFGDEVPFISRVYADYLKFTTANFRKFGHGTVLIAQSFDSLMVERPGMDRDFGIIKNSPIRFMFDAEVPEDKFARDFALSSAELAKIKNLYRGAEYRECLLQTPHPVTGTSSRTLRIKLTPEQYWEFTSSEQDNRKLYDLVRAVPGLTMKEAIRCLSSVS